MPDELVPQVPILLDVLAALGICAIGAPGYEADDVIATLAHRADGAGERAEVVTGDRDLFGVVTDLVTVLYTGRGVAKLEVIHPAEVTAKYGIPSRSTRTSRCCAGTPATGCPACPESASARLRALVTRFGGIEDILAAARDDDTDGLPSRQPGQDRLRRGVPRGGARRGQRQIDVDLPAGLPDALPTEPANPERLLELSDRWGLERPVERMLHALAAPRD